jgi:hypothetical protein
MRLFPSSILLSLFLILISCGEASKTRLSEAEEKLFVETYVKLALATWDHPADADSLTVLRQAVFAEVDIDEQQFVALSRQAEASPERWVVIWEQIVQRLEKERAEADS